MLRNVSVREAFCIGELGGGRSYGIGTSKDGLSREIFDFGTIRIARTLLIENDNARTRYIGISSNLHIIVEKGQSRGVSFFHENSGYQLWVCHAL